jgi:hypothetical protein
MTTAMRAAGRLRVRRFLLPGKATGTSQCPGGPAGRAGQDCCSNLGGLHLRRGRLTSPNSATIPLPVGLGTRTTPWRAVRVPKPGCGLPRARVHSCRPGSDSIPDAARLYRRVRDQSLSAEERAAA